ncbi:PX domain-containing protein [Apiospora kogelbergensis]|uniref:PX domain-containing protein n=1 Tax=Apiospora kogelbergensis TaxID=1337665 RepID=UPI003131B489
MWNDEEDNNPYGTSFDRRDSVTSSSVNAASPTSRDYNPRFAEPQTPSTTSEEAPPPPRSYGQEVSDADSDEEYAAQARAQVPRQKPGGYGSRIEQVIYENPELPIMITDAGKSAESGGRYIVYTIRTGDLEVRRRYSEFASLRDALTRLHPTLIIPPIPEKHTMADYAANPTNAKQDQQIIDLRKRMLAVFLNRCRKMVDVLSDGVCFYPEVGSESAPAGYRQPDRGAFSSSDPCYFVQVEGCFGRRPPSTFDSPAATTGPQILQRFPPDTHGLSEQELDPYFNGFEASIKDMEHLLMGSMEKVNRRTLSHLTALSGDMSDLGAKYNAFALSEQDSSLAAAIERVGQAADSSYIATEELAGSLGASFAEPMRENAQFAGVIRNVLRYRTLKRVQQEMTNDELIKKRMLLDQLERSEAEARRIEQYLSSSQQIGGAQPHQPPRRSSSMRENSTHQQHHRESSGEDTASIDSDFPLHTEIFLRRLRPELEPLSGVVDVDPERTRRDTMGKTHESIEHLEQAQVAAAQDVKDASGSILKDLKRFQGEKEEDLRRYMLAYAKSQIEWARKNKEAWEEAKAEIQKIEET